MIPTRFVDGKWRIFPSSILTSPHLDADWIKYHPLRISIISDKNLKAGCATNPREFVEIMTALGMKAKIDYAVGKRAEMESLKPNRFGERRPEAIFGGR
jgi:hypothetical protein